MRKSILAASVAIAALLPTLALAQSSCAERQHDQRVAGTVIGGVAGALLGNAVSSHGGKPGGTIIGAVAGAAVGNQVTRGSADCSHAYGYYDRDGRWQTTNVRASDATGYYDRDGSWVEGRPAGYYDQSGRWVAATYADPDQQRGYQGDHHDRWEHAGADTTARKSWLEQKIRADYSAGRIDRRTAGSELHTLADIRRDDARMRRDNGQLDDRDQARIQGRLDSLADSVRAD